MGDPFYPLGPNGPHIGQMYDHLEAVRHQQHHNSQQPQPTRKADSGRPSGRGALKTQVDQIRTWVREGRTDPWIAHQFMVSVRDISAFRREHQLSPPQAGGSAIKADDLDLRAEDEALVAAALEAELEANEDKVDGDGKQETSPGRKRKSRRGSQREVVEGTFDHGGAGYGLWLDPCIQDAPVYIAHWAGQCSVTVVVEPRRITITRASE